MRIGARVPGDRYPYRDRLNSSMWHISKVPRSTVGIAKTKRDVEVQ
jgi:hypothetical protein